MSRALCVILLGTILALPMAAAEPAAPFCSLAAAPLPVSPLWQPAAAGASCDGACDTGTAEVVIHHDCPGTMSAQACCNQVAAVDPPGCIHFEGTCAGTSEIVCQF